MERDLLPTFAPALDMIAPVLRALLGIVLVTVLPGLALSFALEPSRTMSVPIRLCWAFALSITVAIVSGMVLSATGIPFVELGWYVMLTAITAGAACVAMARRPAFRGVRFAVPGWQVIPIGGAVAAMILTMAVTHMAVLAEPQTPFTQLWIVPQPDSAGNAVLIGVRNREQVEAEFRVVVWAGTDKIAEWPSVQLENDASWSHRLTFPRGQWPAVRDQPVEVLLYWQDRPQVPYRRVSLACGTVSQETMDAIQTLFRTTSRCTALPTPTAEVNMPEEDALPDSIPAKIATQPVLDSVEEDGPRLQDN